MGIVGSGCAREQLVKAAAHLVDLRVGQAYDIAHASLAAFDEAEDTFGARMDEILEIRLDVEKIMLGAALVVEEHAVQLTGLGNEDIAVGDAVEVIAGDDDTVSADEEEDFVKPVCMQMMV